MQRIVSFEEAAKLVRLSKADLVKRIQADNVKTYRDATRNSNGLDVEDLRRYGYTPPEPSRPPPPPPPKPEAWTPSHAEMAALIKLNKQGRDARIAELVRQHPHLAAWFKDNPLPPVFRKREPPAPPQAKPPPPPPPPRQSWQTSWQGEATWQQYQTPPRPEPPPVKPVPPDPPKRQQPPPRRPAPAPQTSEPSPPIGRLLWLLLIALSEAGLRPFAGLRDRLDHATSEQRQKVRSWLDRTGYGQELAKLWENKAGRALIFLVGVYLVWRIL